MVVDEVLAEELAPVPKRHQHETDRKAATKHADADGDDDEPLPSFSEQMSQQLGGVRGLVESSIPVTVFVILNYVGSTTHWWSLRQALVASLIGALLMVAFRLYRRQPIRHAFNGVFGIVIGAVLAWRSGDARDFYLPGIIYTAGYAAALLASVAFRRPLVGWLWAVMFDGGAGRWYQHPRLLRAFSWLTVVWAAVYLVKVGVQSGLYLTHQTNWLGVTRLVLGWPPYALLLGGTIWKVRQIMRSDPELRPAGEA
jgi:hypothetical protein